MSTVILDFTVAKIISLLEKEVSLLEVVGDELGEIKNELVCMKSFLEDADGRGVHLEVEKTWVENVRNIAYDVEDIIDEFIYHLKRQQRSGNLTRFLHQIIRLPLNLWVRRGFTIKLRKINYRIKAISERHNRYGANPIIATTQLAPQKHVINPGESSLFISDDDLVGIQADQRLLLTWLMDEEVQRTVISVVGMGGSGKTTLVAKVYNSQTMKQHFDCYAWISVSQTYEIEDLFKVMIKEFQQSTDELLAMGLSGMSYKQLVEILVNYLEPRRYVIVLDDVWNINFWSQIKVSLPDGRRGSRVLLTTRKEDIASFSFGVRSYVHHIPPLGKKEAWDLFCLRAFSGNPNRCSPEMEILGKDIVGKCEGLPLAIVALGGLMSSKTLELEWRKVSNSLNWELSNNPVLEVVKCILLLSFNDLPYRLKHCFLYCCIFPKDKPIRRTKLTRLWMAEGFAEQVNGLTPEEVGESYLMELICRNMLQVVEKNPSGRPKSCKMHDLMRDLALSISERARLCIVYDGGKAKAEWRWARRLSVLTSDNFNSFPSMPRLRSFFVFLTDTISPSFQSIKPSSFRLIRVLDMEYVPIHTLPNELGDLFNLRFLNLKGTMVEELPKSISKLHNLQTLNLYQTKVKVLPSGIVKLQNLRYLICCHYDLKFIDDFDYATGMRAPSCITNLKDLQVLHFVDVNADIVRHVKNLNQLTCLGMTKVKEVDEMDLCSSVEEMTRLRHLSVMAINEKEVLKLDSLSTPPPHLRRLNLIGKLERLPHWFCLLQSLTALYLNWSRLQEDPLPCIQTLPNLRRLTLVNAYMGRRLCFSTGFQRLQSLTLRNFNGLNEIIIEKGVMPDIQNLWISRCLELKMLPQGIEHLTSLQKMTLSNVSDNAIRRIRGEESLDRPKVQHISKINHYYQTTSGWSYESL